MNLISFIKNYFHHLLTVVILLSFASCGYIQVNPPPDVMANEDPSDQSAWLAASSNMLAAAGYGYGNNIQERAENIYEQMLERYGSDNDGWTDAALQWWISSEHNDWPENPYKLVTVIGNKRPTLPWDDPAGAAKIGDLLREGDIVSASITWPVPDDPGNSRGGHVLNCWGDDKGENKNPGVKPEHLRVTDCYRNKGGIIQTYSYSGYNDHILNGDTTNGWYIEYDENQPYIKHIVLLSKVLEPENGKNAFMSRTMVMQMNKLDSRADKMTIDYSSSEPLLSFSSSVILKDEDHIPGKIRTDLSEDDHITSSWNFSRNDLVMDAEFMLLLESVGSWNSWTGLDQGFVSDKQGQDTMYLPGFSWKMEGSETKSKYLSASATGGYFLLSLSFEILDTLDIEEPESFTAYLMRQYPAGIDPERPTLHFTTSDSFRLKSLKAVHSYGIPEADSFTSYDYWIVSLSPGHLISGDTLSIPLKFPGLLPYPEGENYSKRIAGR